MKREALISGGSSLYGNEENLDYGGDSTVLIGLALHSASQISSKLGDESTISQLQQYLDQIKGTWNEIVIDKQQIFQDLKDLTSVLCCCQLSQHLDAQSKATLSNLYYKLVTSALTCHLVDEMRSSLTIRALILSSLQPGQQEVLQLPLNSVDSGKLLEWLVTRLSHSIDNSGNKESAEPNGDIIEKSSNVLPEEIIEVLHSLLVTWLPHQEDSLISRTLGSADLLPIGNKDLLCNGLNSVLRVCQTVIDTVRSSKQVKNGMNQASNHSSQTDLHKEGTNGGDASDITSLKSDKASISMSASSIFSAPHVLHTSARTVALLLAALHPVMRHGSMSTLYHDVQHTSSRDRSISDESYQSVDVDAVEQVPRHLVGVVDSLLVVVSEFVASASECGGDPEKADVYLNACECLLSSSLPLLVAASQIQAVAVVELMARLRPLLHAVARTAERLSRPNSRGSEGGIGRQSATHQCGLLLATSWNLCMDMREQFRGKQSDKVYPASVKVCQTCCEVVSRVLAVSWASDYAMEVTDALVTLRNIIEPSSRHYSTGEKQITVNVMARTGVLLQNDPTAISHIQTALSSILTSPIPQPTCADTVQAISGALPTSRSTASLESHLSNADTPLTNGMDKNAACMYRHAGLYAAVCHGLAQLAAAAASEGHMSMYQAIVDALVRSYSNYNGPLCSALLHSSNHPTGYAGCLAIALRDLALSLPDHARSARMDLLHSYLMLFANFAVSAKTAEQIKDLGELLQPIAGACQGLTMQGLSKARSCDSTQPQDDDLDQNVVVQFSPRWPRLTVLLWVYVSIHDFGGQSNKDNTWPKEWNTALGQIAQVTPLLLWKGGTLRDKDFHEIFRSMLSSRLEMLGPLASAKRVLHKLERYSVAGGFEDQPPQTTNMNLTSKWHASNTFLLAVAYLEASRAQHGITSNQNDETPPPMSVMLKYLEVSNPTQYTYQAYIAIANHAFHLYLRKTRSAKPPVKHLSHVLAPSVMRMPTLQGAPCSGPNSPSLTPVPVASLPRDEADALNQYSHSDSPAAQLAQLLCTALSTQPYLNQARGIELRKGRSAGAQVQMMSDSVVSMYPSVLYRRGCLSALLDGVYNSARSLGPDRNEQYVRRLYSWVDRGAKLAPEVMQSALTEFCGQDSSTSSQAFHQHSSQLFSITQKAGQSSPWPEKYAIPPTLIASAHQKHISKHNRSLARPSGQQNITNSYVVGSSHQHTSGACEWCVEAGEHSKFPIPYVPAGKSGNDRLMDVVSKLRAGANSEEYQDLEVEMVKEIAYFSTAANRFCPVCVSQAKLAWLWLIQSRPDLSSSLVSHLYVAWNSTISNQLGLFSNTVTTPTSESPKHSNYVPQRLLAHKHTPISLEAHNIILVFLQQLFVTKCDRDYASGVAIPYILQKLCNTSLSKPSILSKHPAGIAPYFRLLSLALQVVAYFSTLAKYLPDHAARISSKLLYERTLYAAYQWFIARTGYFHFGTNKNNLQSIEALKQCTKLLETTPPPDAIDPVRNGKPSPSPSTSTRQKEEVQSSTGGSVWHKGPCTKSELLTFRKQLITILKYEAHNAAVWADPCSSQSSAQRALCTSDSEWAQLAKTLWDIDPALAVGLWAKFPNNTAVHAPLHELVRNNAYSTYVQSIPLASNLLIQTTDGYALKVDYSTLATWAPLPYVDALKLLSDKAQVPPAVLQYALRSLSAMPIQQALFVLPQLVQQLRGSDPRTTQHIMNMLISLCGKSRTFTHQLMWQARAEARPPEEAFNPRIKRSGWQPPKDTGLWQPTEKLIQAIKQNTNSEDAKYMDEEIKFFDDVTAISGKLSDVPKSDRKAAVQSYLKQLKPSRPDLYLPTNPSSRVAAILPKSGRPMPSAAKVPIWVGFEIQKQVHISVDGAPEEVVQEESSQNDEYKENQSQVLCCIFKVGDDVRQDVLALQIINLLKNVFTAANLDLYLKPYGCIPTNYEQGIIEVVPNTQSRAGLGNVCDGGLYEIFQSHFGAPGSASFEAARLKFIQSEAGYAVASYLLQAKDRHNGNVLIDKQGHLVHIDFGFILEISPGGNMKFESAAFKFSHEMQQLIDPSAKRTSQSFKYFEELVVRGFLAARTIAPELIAYVELMAKSGLPCFSRGEPVKNFAKRLMLNLQDDRAACKMRGLVKTSYTTWTTGAYDWIQKLQNNYPM